MEQKENTLLFGHAGEGLTKNAQTNILNVLNAKYPEIEHTLIDLWMSFPDDYIQKAEMMLIPEVAPFCLLGLPFFQLQAQRILKS